jgi:SAM-dependent methyltransferase
MTDPDGTAEEWDADRYDDQCSFVYEYGESVTELLDVGDGDAVLDVGCGTGHLSRRLADRGARVVGVDSAPDMVGRARDAHGDAERVRFVRGDARDLVSALGSDALGTFDAAFSNAALHWIPGDDHDTVLEGVARLLRPGGAFVAEFGGRGNVGRIVEAATAELDARGYEAGDPWYFPSVGEYAPRVEAHGFEVREARLFDRPTELDEAGGIREWLGVFGDTLFGAVPDEEHDAVLDGVADRLRDDLYRDGRWVVDYRRIRFRAVRE